MLSDTFVTPHRHFNGFVLPHVVTPPPACHPPSQVSKALWDVSATQASDTVSDTPILPGIKRNGQLSNMNTDSDCSEIVGVGETDQQNRSTVKDERFSQGCIFLDSTGMKIMTVETHSSEVIGDSLNRERTRRMLSVGLQMNTFIQEARVRVQSSSYPISPLAELIYHEESPKLRLLSLGKHDHR
ncbi:unnamed protein product [Somion occarium]|uniref:Uncharacterized protein n=1 Tax=Somion occarium TaxID=3059160 RepID=A0ABP1CSM4_9APHY